MECVNVELLVVPNCPNEARAADALREAATHAGIVDLGVTVTVIDSDEDAQRRRFVGSPTFLINGTDPFAVAGAPSGLTCRVYRTAAGPSGLPEIEQLRDALLAACTSPPNTADD